MDILTLKKAQKYAQALVETISEEIGDMGGDLEDLEDSLKDLASDTSIIDKDGDLASALLINALRQHFWKNEADALICEEGSKVLSNSARFPFNNSQESVALVNTQRNTKYVVIADVTSATGNAGEVAVTDKQVNGFKLAFNGGASSATVHYIVIGGIL